MRLFRSTVMRLNGNVYGRTGSGIVWHLSFAPYSHGAAQCSRTHYLVFRLVAKRTFRKVHEFWSKWFFRVFGHLEWNFLVLSKMPEDLTIELPL